jgi:hypothetical protein
MTSANANHKKQIPLKKVQPSKLDEKPTRKLETNGEQSLLRHSGKDGAPLKYSLP